MKKLKLSEENLQRIREMGISVDVYAKLTDALETTRYHPLHQKAVSHQATAFPGDYINQNLTLKEVICSILVPDKSSANLGFPNDSNTYLALVDEGLKTVPSNETIPFVVSGFEQNYYEINVFVLVY